MYLERVEHMTSYNTAICETCGHRNYTLKYRKVIRKTNYDVYTIKYKDYVTELWEYMYECTWCQELKLIIVGVNDDPGIKVLWGFILRTEDELWCSAHNKMLAQDESELRRSYIDTDRSHRPIMYTHNLPVSNCRLHNYIWDVFKWGLRMEKFHAKDLADIYT